MIRSYFIEGKVTFSQMLCLLSIHCRRKGHMRNQSTNSLMSR
uniref:Uncharacterized protein n=1 Tax=Brassica campestris TaxID=3711 RepID=A0A3P6B0Z1_BRACM|nr:unnamed protein product [Brassica rapa]